MRNVTLSLALAGLFSLRALAGEAPNNLVNLKVKLFNYAKVSQRTLSEAKETATAIFRREGIHIEWLDCPISPEEVDQYPACTAVSSPLTPNMKLIDEVMTKGFPRRPGELGFALLDGQTGYGTDSWIFFQKVRDSAEATSSGLRLVLGNAMAHELGHLLLGTGQHTRTGIMRPDWDRESLRRAERGELGFTREQATRMRVRIAARFQAVIGTATLR